MSIVVIVALVVVIAIAIIASYAMSQQRNEAGTMPYHRLTPQHYQTTFATSDHLLVDVRSPEEFATGHIPGAVNIALSNLPQQMATLPKDRPIVLYCRSGARSNTAAAMLAKHGFGNVHDLGGIITWQAQGLPVN
jgi:rhodanese-related sulfurtransferase